MEHTLIALVAPLVELYPARYALRPAYRRQAVARLGRRAGRIFACQLVVGVLSLATLALVLAMALP